MIRKTTVIILLLISGLVKAQDSASSAFRPQLYIATDVLKLTSNFILYNDYNNNAEGELRLMLGKQFGIYGAMGYSERHIRHVSRYQNLENYSSKGSYIHAGLCIQNDNEKVRFIMNVGYIRSRFSEKGEFVIKGNYWDNDRISRPMAFSTVSWGAIAIEPAFRVMLFPQLPKLTLYTGFGITLSSQTYTYPYENSEIYDYKPVFVPGIMDRAGFGPLRLRMNLCYRL